jgi:hypothetical protein
MAWSGVFHVPYNSGTLLFGMSWLVCTASIPALWIDTIVLRRWLIR